MGDPNEAVRILDLCDRVLGQPSQRGHRFAWLLASADPAAEPARVDAWYPELRLAVDVRGLHDDDELHRRAGIVRAYDLEYAVVDATDEEGVREQVASEQGKDRQLAEWGAAIAVYGMNVGLDDPGWDEGTDEEEDVFADWDWDEDEEDERPGGLAARPDDKDLSDFLETGPLDSGAAQVLGWRARSIALGLLGALALARRTLRVDAEDHLPRDPGIDVLLVLAAAEARPATSAGLGPDEIAHALAVDDVYVTRVLRGLRKREQVVAGGVPEEGPEAMLWSLTPNGLEAVVELLARAAPHFRGWPPD